jgi:hypothetical protein
MRLAGLALWLALAGCTQTTGSPPVAEKPDLALLTSLPIVFGESFGFDAPPSALLKVLEENYAVRPVDGPEQLKRGGLLLAIQPQALTAERLVALDQWVREGGRLVLLADPSLSWESSRPLGDRFRPPYAFADTGLLENWGLALDQIAETGEEQGAKAAGGDLGSRAETPGRLQRKSGGCRIQQAGFLAVCQIGRGLAIVAADADIAMSDDSGTLDGINELVGTARKL